jgi:hypothetical protein
MAWIPLESRSAELQAAVQAKATEQGADITAQAFYDANELGLLEEAALLAWLNKAVDDPVDQAFTPNPAAAAAGNATKAPLREEDIYMVKTLGWLMQNAHTLEDKAIARKKYHILLFDLWRKYLAQTGETWYPPLREDLWEHYQFKTRIVSE